MSGVGLGAGAWLGSFSAAMEGSLVGFQDKTKSTISINDGSLTFTITPVAGPYYIYVNGQRLEVSSTKSITWPNLSGPHYIYFDETASLQVVQTFNQDIITRYAFVSIVGWDAVAGSHIYFAEERHGIHMGKQTHLYLHNTQGAKFDRGLGLTGFLVDGTGNDPANAQFTAQSGRIWDEDLQIDVPAQTTIPVLYRLGSIWKKKPANAFPVIYSGTAGYAGTRLPYNLNTAGVWSLAEVDPNKFVLVHVFATNDIETPIVAVQGTAQYASKTAARDGAGSELQSLSGLPFAEFVPIGTVIFETATGYLNTPHARVVSIDGANYADKRATYFRPDTL